MAGRTIMTIARGDVIWICGPREVALMALIAIRVRQLIVTARMARDALLVGMCTDERKSCRRMIKRSRLPGVGPVTLGAVMGIRRMTRIYRARKIVVMA
jgi:hypothetical protein